MESPRKFNDCYFYYYSTCTKGDNCVFRHEPSALGCETMCTAWQQGKCLDKRCKLRHMELRKNRKQIPCYWENQPGGCRKKHCPFMHKNPDARTDGIAPSQPAPSQPSVGVGVPGVGVPGVGVGGVPVGASVVGVEGVGDVAPVPAPPAPLPMLWQHQQQRQVVLDSAILGVLPAPELLRREHYALPPPAHAPQDPLVVNFEEESDNESAPSSTPTKASSPGARSKNQELLLLERIQAEAAAFYSYEPLPERLSLDDLAGKKPAVPNTSNTQRRRSLDFKVLSLDEIRARKKMEAATIAPTKPITLNLSRKRKLSTQETVTTAGNKIIKVVRSNSIVYKKVDPETPPATIEAKTDQKLNDSTENRKRTLSETINEVYEMQENELVDDCYELKRIKLTEQTSKPRLIRNRPLIVNNESQTKDSKDNDSDSEVQIVSVALADTTNVELSDSEVIDLDTTKMGDPVDIVDLSDDDDVTITGEMATNVPDVVASCHKKVDATEKDLLKDINSLINDNDSLEEDL